MEVAPFIKNSRTYLPVRYVAEAMGIAPDNITYSNGTVSIKKGDRLIRLFANSPILIVNDKSVAMDVNTVMINGRTMLPIKWVAEAFDTSVAWNQTAKSVSISYADETLAVSRVENLPDITYPSLTDGQKLNKSFSWSYGTTTYKWNIEIPNRVYNYDLAVYSIADSFLNSDLDKQRTILKSTPNAGTKDLLLSLQSDGNYAAWVNESLNDAYIKNVAKCFSNQAAYDGYDYLHTAEFVQSFVGGALKYKAIDVPQLPAKTLIDGGDSTGKSILLASILKNMSYKVALLRFDPLPGSEVGHMAVGLALDSSKAPSNASNESFCYAYEGQNYYYAETTTPGFHIGELGDLSDNSVDLNKANIYLIN
jgi:hypothetical protein